ncbi:efflux RND transporter periplasmic adaptor subunit [Acuticoccus mangrovi]|uniref:Efflux RND transporter periplasmic adaptor subunit n=1 Tax=Acuticoccus mangrovi TaxID=2796142 RepID=A0A934INW2_9HYPH|nr:efflux RND transporter periplasmic adaptor subunit [Acuticoccus mangrovi]MBJ3775911.1 efflux RND transporter periplasmic adaptor subunit [Acuticoccus mangrovi]
MATPTANAPRIRTRSGLAAILLATAAVGAATSAEAQNSAPPPAVVVEAVKAQNVSRSGQYVGRIQAIQSVDLVARVEGFLDSVNFAEGSMVKKGTVLFNIERAPYEASLAAAQGQLAAAKAQVTGSQATLKNAQTVLDRQLALVKRGTVSQATADDAQASRDTAAAQVEQAQASVQQAEASVQSAQLNLSYTDVVAPIDGRIGVVAITEGNLVNTASGTLATINQLNPIRVAFSIPEALYINLMQGVDPDAPKSSGNGASSSATATGGAASSPATPSTSGSDTSASAATTGSSDTSSSGTSSSGTGTTAPTDGGAAAATSTSPASSSDAGQSAAAGTDGSGASGASASAAGGTGAAPAAATPGPLSGRPPSDLFEPLLTLANGSTYDQDGDISFASNQIDPGTGTLVIYADFPNPKAALLPGAFVTVKVQEAQKTMLPVIPASAILQDREGQYVFVLDGSNTVQERRIQTGQTIEAGVPVTEGLVEGDTIIVQGIQKVRPGIAVTPTRASASGSGASGSGTSGGSSTGGSAPRTGSSAQ